MGASSSGQVIIPKKGKSLFEIQSRSVFQIEISYEFTEIKIYMQFNFKNNMTELEAMNGFQPETWKVTKTKKSTNILRNVKVCAANNVNASKAMKGP